MHPPKFQLSVVMQRRPINNRWQTEIWTPVAVVEAKPADLATGPVDAADGVQQWVSHGLLLTLRREEAEGYYLNISTQQPRVFVMWQMENERAVPQCISASYNDACSWMDAGEQVDSVAMPPGLYDAVSAFAREHYRPQPKKRIRPRSFQSRDQRARSRE